MAKATKKIYKVRDKTTGEFVSLGYSRKSHWATFPHVALHYYGGDKDNLIIEQYETVYKQSFNAKGEEISGN